MERDKNIRSNIQWGKAVMTRGVARLAVINDRFSGFIANSLKRHMEEVSPQHGAGLFSRCRSRGLPEICIASEPFPEGRLTVMFPDDY